MIGDSREVRSGNFANAAEKSEVVGVYSLKLRCGQGKSIEAVDERANKDRLENLSLVLKFQATIPDQPEFLKASSANALLWINAASNGFFHETWTPRYFTLVLTGTWCPFLKCRIGVSKRGSSRTSVFVVLRCIPYNRVEEFLKLRRGKSQ